MFEGLPSLFHVVLPGACSSSLEDCRDTGNLSKGEVCTWWFTNDTDESFPDAPCMEYLPLFTYIYPNHDPHVITYLLHGASGIDNLGPWLID